MTEIDFYVLATAAPGSREQLACRLAEKAYGLGHDIFIHAADAGQASALDELLWTFRDGSFLPHGLVGEEERAPVLIGSGGEPAKIPYLLINLAGDVPPFFSRFERVAEVINDEASIRDAGRERFRFYRERGYSLKTHKL